MSTISVDVSSSSSDSNQTGSVHSFGDFSTLGIEGSSERSFSDDETLSIVTPSEKSASPELEPLEPQKIISDSDTESEIRPVTLPSTSRKITSPQDANDDKWEILNTEYFQQYSYDFPSSSESDSDIEIREKVKKMLQKERLEKEKQREQYFKTLQIPEYPGMTVGELSHNRIYLRFAIKEMIDDPDLKDFIEDYRYRIILKPDHHFFWHIDYSSVPPEANIRDKFIRETVHDEDILDCIDYFYSKIHKFLQTIIKDKMELQLLEESGVLDD